MAARDRFLTNEKRLEAKHAEDSRINASRRRLAKWEKTPAGQDCLAACAEFSAIFRTARFHFEAHVALIKGLPAAPRLVVTGGRTFCETHNVLGVEIKPLSEATHERKAMAWALDTIAPSFVVHGGAHGLDRWAQIWCERRGVPFERVEALWTELGFQAGPERNGRMVRDYEASAGCVFPGGRGTADCARQMAAAGLPVYVADLAAVYERL